MKKSNNAKTSSWWQKVRKIDRSTKILIIFALILLVIKLILTSWRTSYAIPNALSDDGLMQKEAISLLNFHWLGHFDAFTLCKNNVFSFYLAILNFLGIPLLVGNEILFFVATLMVVFLLKKYTKNAWILCFAFALIFMNPASFASATSVRIYRDSIYQSITMICISSIFYLLSNIANNKEFIKWLIIYSLVFVVFWFSREESIWILPIVIIISILISYHIGKNKKIEHKKRNISLVFIGPAIAVAMTGLGISAINYFAYGVFTTTEDQLPAYKDFYASINKIESDNRTDTIDFPKDLREKIYSVSPTFSTIKENYEQQVFPSIKTLGDDPEEVNSGWTTWSIRYAMLNMGYYDNAKNAEAFYASTADEINDACAAKTLDCSNKKPGILSTLFSKSPQLLSETVKNISYVYNFSDLAVKEHYASSDPRSIEQSESLTGENVFTTNVSEDGEKIENPSLTTTDAIKMKTLRLILKMYQIITPILSFISIPVLAASLIYKIRMKKKLTILYIAAAFLIAFLIRCLIVSYLNITAFYATGDLYLYCAYPLLLSFIASSVVLAAKIIYDTIKEKKGLNEKED